MALKKEVGDQASEFGGTSGTYQNERQEVVDRIVKPHYSKDRTQDIEARGGTPGMHLARARAVNPLDATGKPDLGDGGVKVQ